jgi:hypothetical protein
VGVVHNVLLNHLFDSMMHIQDANPLWDHNDHFVQRNFNGKNKGKGKQQPFNAKTSITFKKKKKYLCEMSCFTCGGLEHFAKDIPKHADCKEKKVNLVTATNAHDGYGSIPTVLSVFQSPSWWLATGANIHVCADISLFSSYQLLQGSSVLMGNGSHASVRGIGTVDLKFTSGKIVQHVPTIHKNLVSVSLLLRDGFKVVLESNKEVMSKHGQFIGKGYDCGGLFRLSLADFCNKSVNHICGTINDNSSVWHSRLCHVNFGLMSYLSSLQLIPDFTIAKGSKCHSCVQSKQP